MSTLNFKRWHSAQDSTVELEAVAAADTVVVEEAAAVEDFPVAADQAAEVVEVDPAVEHHDRDGRNFKLRR